MNISDTTLAETRAAAIGAECESPEFMVRVARTVAEVEGIRDYWSSWKTHRDSDIDYCLECDWRTGDFIRPHVIVLYRNGGPDAILVGRLLRARIPLGFGYLKFGSVPVRLLTFSIGGFLGNASDFNAAECVRSVTASLNNGEADVALFHQVDTGSPLFEASQRGPGVFTRDHFVKPVPHHVMRISGSVEQVYAGFSSGSRADLRRKRRKMAGDFGDTFKLECVLDTEDLSRVIAHAEEVTRKTYQRGLGVGFQDNEPMRRWLQVCAERKWLRAYLLSAAGKPAAFWIGTCYAGSFCSDYLSFDPGFRNYSPGTVLFGSMIDDFCAAGVKEVDFGGGEAAYKERFSNWHGAQASIYLFAPSTKGVILNLVRSMVGLLGSATRRFLELTRLSSTVKRVWRARVASKAAGETDA